MSAITEGFQKTNDLFNIRFPNFKCGTTAVIALFRDDTVFVANVGDSRALLGKMDNEGRRIVQEIGRVHTTADAKEIGRIGDSGGMVMNWQGGLRVNGELIVTRSIGDPHMGPCIISDPDITKIDIGREDKFLVLASDGLFDVMSSQEVVDFVFDKKAEAKASKSVNNISDLLVEAALAKQSNDNISAIIVLFEAD